MEYSDLAHRRVLVMGLGLHGGGLATAKYCAARGASVTVTDLRTRAELGAGVEELEKIGVTMVLGEHREIDFRTADIVVKNPAVPRNSPYLAHAKVIETDISLFLGKHAGPVYAVTGTKGKSTTATALHYLLEGSDTTVRLGGNITVSPLSFQESPNLTEPVVLELSSFQLGDLSLTPGFDTAAQHGFQIGIVTNLLVDHQDYYDSMDEYAADKKLIYRSQKPGQWIVLGNDDQYTRGFSPPINEFVARITTGHRTMNEDGWIEDRRGMLELPAAGFDSPVEIVPADLAVIGDHQRGNLLFAGVAGAILGLAPGEIRERLRHFPGVPHRLEFVREADGIRFYNDSAATIADASLAAVRGFSAPVHLIAGGSDKGLPLEALVEASARASSVHLLAGTATTRLLPLLEDRGVSCTGPHDSLADALESAVRVAAETEIVILSPGCASFGLFQNEFDRGDQFRALVTARAK